MNPIKAHLLKALGGKCARCQAETFLQFDVVKGVGNAHHHLNYYARLCFYEAQLQAGNLQLLCPTCHTEKTLADLAAKYPTIPLKCPRCGELLRVGKNRGGAEAEPPLPLVKAPAAL